MITADFKKWLKNKGIDFSDYTLMSYDALQVINAEYVKKNIELDKRYTIKELEKKYPSFCFEMKDLTMHEGKVVSGVIVGVFSNSYDTEERFWELIKSGNEENFILGTAV